MLVPISATSAPPITNPTVVPINPRITFCPVLSAFDRSTASVPKTTQNPCCTEVRSATSTASASAERPAQAVVQPGGARLSVSERALARGRDRARESGRLTPEQPLHPGATRRGGREIDVRRDLVGDIRELLGTEARIQSRDDGGGHVAVGRRRRVLTRGQAGRVVLEFVQSRTQLRCARARGLHGSDRRARVQRRRRRARAPWRRPA